MRYCKCKSQSDIHRTMQARNVCIIYVYSAAHERRAGVFQPSHKVLTLLLRLRTTLKFLQNVVRVRCL